jgi:hypothetical protein
MSPHGQGDRLVWTGTSNGIFSVKSAYHLGMEWIRRETGECSDSAGTDRIWKSIWRLRVPGVVKVFLWRVGHNSLPTRANLFKKQIPQDPLCPVCGLFPETVEHILWSCASATAVWMEGNRKIQKLSFVAMDGCTCWKGLRPYWTDEDLEWVAVVARRIWLRRNSFIFQGDFTPPHR